MSSGPVSQRSRHLTAVPSPEELRVEELEAKVAQLTEGLTSRTVIGQAQGVLMERRRITAAEAFAVLVKASSVSNRKLREIAEELVQTGELPHSSQPDPAPGILREAPLPP